MGIYDELRSRAFKADINELRSVLFDVIDLIEDVARLYKVDCQENIPSGFVEPSTAIIQGNNPAPIVAPDIPTNIRTVVVGANETINYPDVPQVTIPVDQNVGV